MGLQDSLVGVTFECPQEALLEKPKVVRYVLEGNQYSSTEIDKIFSASKAQGKSLYYVDEAILQQVQPDTTQAAEVLGAVVFPLPGPVLGQAHVQHPMQLVLHP